MRTSTFTTGLRLAAIASLVVASTSCGELTRQGTSSSYLVVSELVAASGADPGNFGATLFSDVVTLDKNNNNLPTVFSDLGKVSLTLALKDPGTSTNPIAATPNNQITINRYHVNFVRADGRNTPGVDVPYGFDGAMTFTVSGTVTESFELVRHTAKREAPLAALAGNGVIILTIAEITFYGHDQTGREVSVTSKISVEFGNFGDPTS